ncbi:hypothetical protein A2480_00345 [Candidatus Uhrbacteria bacterium RIFOXYC2_FULL_47_19]|uniref:DDH domain-containing protein n=1 Tax=Candidatus Uhrbacteria bacterium RIFOXYC2_FULL_47_19 TaxID=1802424 RepID=A0A1F7WFC3_9BACT|nr:MAG: hypothetical protein A2480_00345 [Candidatus Uhrbacteria bacterium RIFOXYC2_FULL_47_19]HCC21798.1 hypothetical protein [Candidatus Uhrbacteria bacterium]
MSLTIEKQISESIGRSNQILVAFRKDWNVDAVGSALALTHLLEAVGKKVDVVADGFTATKRIGFLPKTERISSELKQLRQFVISLDLSHAKVDELTYHLEGDKLNFRLTPKSGQFRDRDVTARQTDFRYDLVFTVGTPDLGSLGRMFDDNSDLFYQVPLVNIDHNPDNLGYGNINFVDITATSCAELIHRLYVSPENAVTHSEDTATMLLGGIIDSTRSFRATNVTPRTLDSAAELVAAGGRRDEIVHHLYKTRTISTLKLWGRALARLKYDPEIRMAWSLLVRQDFIHSGSNQDCLPDVMDELMANAPEAEISGLIYEQDGVGNTPGGICALITSERQSDVMSLVPDLKPEGHRRMARICFPGIGLQEAEGLVLASIRKSLGKYKTRSQIELKKDLNETKTPSQDIGIKDAKPSSTPTNEPKKDDVPDDVATTTTIDTEPPDLLKELTAALQTKNLKPISSGQLHNEPRIKTNSN